jgi:predicted Zn-dependent protease
MPYNYQVLNANYLNAYTFPAGSMGLTRSIVAQMRDEAQLAGLLGHEVGHVNARHSAQRQGQGLLAQVAVATVAIAAESRQPGLGGLAQLGGSVGASALLASYSRDNEREADALGMNYMQQAGYDPQGMVRLMQLLNSEKERTPSMLEAMFSSHPMSSERLATATQAAGRIPASGVAPKIAFERYQDRTASIQRLKSTIDACQKCETAIATKRLPEAEEHASAALARTPRDYAGNVLMARALISQKRHSQAQRFLETAKEVLPREAHAHRLSAANALADGKSTLALNDINQAARLLPGDPSASFLRGMAFEQLGDRRQAAAQYREHLQSVQSGPSAQLASQRLREWGVR